MLPHRNEHRVYSGPRKREVMLSSGMVNSKILKRIEDYQELSAAKTENLRCIATR